MTYVLYRVVVEIPRQTDPKKRKELVDSTKELYSKTHSVNVGSDVVQKLEKFGGCMNVWADLRSVSDLERCRMHAAWIS